MKFFQLTKHMFETSTIELSASAYRHNLRFINFRLKAGVRLCSVVKGNAYGHGLTQFVKMAMQAGVDYFAVHSSEEAYLLKQGITKMPDLFIMGAMEESAVKWAVENAVEFAVFDRERLDMALSYARESKKKAKIHLEIETGMRRTGFSIKDIQELSKCLHKHASNITFQGLFTHYAGAESQANHFRISKQIDNFNQALKAFKTEKLVPIYNHSACSAALLNYPETQGNMVRVGILQYGYWPNRETHIRYCEESKSTPDLLKRIIRWTTKVMAVKEVSKGNFIGYGTSYFAHKNMKLAIVPIGYAHGYSRNLSNVGSVIINGIVCNVIGTVNMNSLTVDITLAGKVKPGDEVVLIGSQNGNSISVSSFSEQSHQLNYEMLTRLPMNIPRIVKK
ncbi:MAG: alanine racemase [Bacteroidetes bacterium]|nr:MAG: alanine racemase [Bacteroidota bacterium]